MTATTPFGRLLRDLSPHGLLTLSDHLVLCDSHHDALFLEQTITDALGGEGWGVRQRAAFEASFALLTSLARDLGAVETDTKLSLAAEIFQALGHGLLQFDVTAEGGTVHGAALYHGHGFLEKYGDRVLNRKPLCAFAAGFCSAAASLAFPSDWGVLDAEEVSCVGRGDPECVFVLTRKPERSRGGILVNRAAAAAMNAQLPDAPDDARSAEAAARLAKVLDSASADSAGSVRMFGVRMAIVPATYVGQITFDTMHLVEKRSPDLVPAFFALVREAATMGAFHMLGGALLAQAERGVPISESPHERLADLVGFARAFGWGGFFCPDYVPGASLTLTATVTHESAYYAARHGSTIRHRLASQQGLAIALGLLVDHVDFTRDDPIGPSVYADLMAGPPRYRVEETRSVLRGDSVCEVVVDALDR
ncbi:MAG: 4-vinyl reductase [Polyangiaceae bacterium]